MKTLDTKQAMDLLHNIGAKSVGLCYHQDNDVSSNAKEINKQAYEIYRFLMKKESLKNESK